MKDQSSIMLNFPIDEAPQKQNNFFQRMGRAWLRFSGPNLALFDSSLQSQERLRRSRIISVLHFLVIVTVVLFVPSAIPAPYAWFPLLVFTLINAISFFLNRTNHITASSIFYILAVDGGIAILLTTLPDGLRNTNVLDLDLFLSATLAGGVILPRRFLPFLAIFHITLILLIFTFVPHQQLLTEEIQANGQGFYGEITDCILLQIVGTSIAWLNAWSVDRALLRASKAEDATKAQQRLNEYMQQQMTQREKLEYGIQVLKDAHARFANGDYKARAILQDNALAPLALSFNLLAERLNRIALIALEYSRMEQAFQQLFAIRDAIMHQGAVHAFNPTGTYVDQIYPWLKQFYQTRQLFVQYSKVAERMRLALLQQRTLILQLKSSLEQQVPGKETRFLSSAFENIERSQLLCLQVEDQGKRCLQEARQLEQILQTTT
jgi:hypothetical protein